MSFRIVKLEVWEVKIPFRFTFKHALAERSTAHNLILAAHTDSGHVGYGEILPRTYLTGETIESAWADLASRLWPRLRELDFGAESPLAKLCPLYEEADGLRRTGSYSGVDIAVFDAWARATEIPGNSLFGNQGVNQALTCPVGGGGPRACKWIARLGAWSGYRDFKVKTGRPDDALRLEKVRRVIGEKAGLRVDANAAFTVEKALEQSAMLRRFGVSSVEQPIPAGDFAGLARIQREGGIAVMADESLCTLADARALIAADAAKIWNVRLAKVGGFSGFLRMLDLAQANNIAIHHGVLVGETPAITAAARACSGLARFRHVEYGFPGILLKQKIFIGGPGGNWGIGRPLSPASGLGVEPNRHALENVTINYKCFKD